MIRLVQTNTLARGAAPKVIVPVVQRAFLSGTAFRGDDAITPPVDTIGAQVAVLTGGDRGLANNIAEALCDVHLKALVIFDVLKEPGDDSVAKLSSQVGIPVVFRQVDVRDQASVQEAVNATIKQFRLIDVLVAAGRIADSNLPAETYDVAMFRRLLDINLTGTFICSQAVGAAMITARTGGSMIFITWIRGHVVNWPQQQSCYNASKAGVIRLGKSLAAEWAHHNIRVKSISPGYMDIALNRVRALDAQNLLWKERTPMGAVDELNNLVVFLSSDASTYMIGTDIIIDSGYTAW
ncbi:hypothetical protein FN846DRAFT_1014017 [Sphaerosporella brunnea]|uniref:NAD(P)-binding protein n=1 Tax=Sphaerosporella brunnea TaxID=1250544 RepID=A0A5J5EY65_9PEZI|nr:hypothetical protein FN846DRAFT_1014017 [Sphaerosporella brunnea]